MKKIIALLMALVMVLSMAACGAKDESADFKVGAIYINSKNDTAGYTFAHHNGITKAMEELGMDPATQLVIVDEVPEDDEAACSGSSGIIYEPDSEEVFAAIVPEYLGGMLYGAICESRAAEQAARRSAMDSATQNADDMIADLSLKFNRARQAAITQEITEIVAGS